MEEKTRSRRDFIQNITITLLSLLAVVLFVRTQVYGRSFSALSSLAAPTPTSSAVIAENTSRFSGPVRVAVSGSYGRYGSITLSTASDSFAPLGNLLGEALRSVQTYAESSEAELLKALEHPSVYYDFLLSLPLSVMAGFVDSTGDDTLSARRLVLSEPDGNGVMLYLRDDAGRCLRCTTALSGQALENVISQYEQGSAVFAFDTVQTYGEYAVQPLSLFLTEPELPLLASAVRSVPSDQVLSALGFNPHTQTRWTETSGTEVIVDSDRTLRIRSDGTLDYQSGGSTALQVTAAGALPTLWEAASDVSTLLSALLPEGCEAQLYLRSFSRSGASMTLSFDYQYNGIPIRFSDGSTAARVTLSGAAVSSITFAARQYAAGDETALLLPLQQAMAVTAQKTPERELFIGYADYGTEQTAPQWLSE